MGPSIKQNKNMKTRLLTLACLLITGLAANAQTPAADSLTAYVGTYSFASGSPVNKFVVTIEKGDLYGEADGNGTNKLLKQPAADTFKSTSTYGSVITFSRDAATKAVTGFVLVAQDTELQARRDKP